MHEPIKMAIVGGRRGRAIKPALKFLSEKVQLVAVCDLLDEVLSLWRSEFPEVKLFKDYDTMLERSDCDAVFIATPLFLHAEQAIKAMRMGKHVLSEVIASTTLDEGRHLIETVEDTGMTYMLAENYCYMRPNMLILNMVEQGIFGEIIYAEGGYIHDCRNLLFYPDGSLTWRGEMSRRCLGCTYPTHSIGPIAQWLRINKEGGDRFLRLASFQSKSSSIPLFVRKNFGDWHPGIKPDFWLRGDSSISIIQTEKDVLIVIRVDYHSPRPHNMSHYSLQGTGASYLSPRHGSEDPLIWIDGRSPGQSPGNASWEPLWKYTDEYEHPYWRELGGIAERFGHGGGDFFVFKDFIDSILENKVPPIDVYDAVTWSSIAPLSAESIAKGGIPIEMPDFISGRKK
ncbi:MAG: Gfo/Idh/MocA family oxidoreductase [Candidatus Bathyarchaeia archaeon]